MATQPLLNKTLAENLPLQKAVHSIAGLLSLFFNKVIPYN
jgi:hypothetical protein